MREVKPMAEAADDFLTGGGLMEWRIRACDWSHTALGPLEKWPHSLKTALKIALNSRYPIWMGWGRDLITLYNEPYIPVLGKRDEWALGAFARDVWKEVWEEHLGPQAEAVVLRGEAFWNDQRQMVMCRNGYAEETYFTFSFSPLLADEGGIGGLFCVCTEDTQKVLGERRLAALRHLAAATADVRTEEQAAMIAVQTLSEHGADVSFALIYVVAGDGTTASLAAGSRGFEGAPWAPPRIVLTDRREMGSSDSWPLWMAMMNGTQVLRDLKPERALPGGQWPESTTVVTIVPLAQMGYRQARGFLIVGASPRLPFDAHYESFFELLARGIADAFSNARAYEEERKRAEALAELDRAKTAFFSNVSHEFRTPLTLMLGRVEELLKKSHTDLDAPAGGKRFLEYIVESSPDMLFVHDIPADKTLYINRSLESILGYSLPEFHSLPNTTDALVHPNDHDGVLRWYAGFDRARDGEVLEHELRARHADGSYRWILSRATVFERTEDGKAKQIIGVATDVTERRQAEQALRESEARFRTIAEAVPSFLFETDAEGLNIWTSEGWRRFTGQTREEVAGHGWAAALHPDDRADNIDKWTQCMRDGVPFESRQRLRRFDGRYSWVVAKALPVRDKGGTIDRWVGSVTDVDEIVRTEEALRDSQAQLEAELVDIKLLQGISAVLVEEHNAQALYERILDAAVSIMRSECASMQMLSSERGDGGALRLLACRGFSPQAEKSWEWVRTDSESTCGRALREGRRVVVPDVEQCEWMAGTEDRAIYLDAGIHAVQTTPLLSRDGRLLGVISTHWRDRHQPSERDVRLFDILVRQAADLLERKQAEDTMRRNHTELCAHVEELERFNRIAIDRELRMIELKQEVNDLRRMAGLPPSYPLNFEKEIKNAGNEETPV